MKIDLKNKKTIIIISIAVILIIAIISVFLVLKNSKNGNKTNNIKNNNPSKETKKVQIIDENSTSRPYAVMINNINIARPLQSGLQDAYLIYEIIVEGGISRYMALFMDAKTERIGSIRSSRHYFLDYALENDAIYVHHGQSPQAQRDFSVLGVDRVVVDNTKTGWRDTSLNVSSEHTLFTSIDKLNNGLGSLRTTRNKNLLLDYSAEELDLSKISDSKENCKISIAYSAGTKVYYEYDNENKYYLRSTEIGKHVDYVTKEQYHFKNIIAYQVGNSTINDGENKGRQEINNIGSGTGYYFSNGYVNMYMDGTKLKVNDGNTFIQIVPNSGSVSWE